MRNMTIEMERQESFLSIANNTTIHLRKRTDQKEVTEMLAMGILFGIVVICGFIWLYYSRSFKQAEVLLFQKGSLLTNQSRYLVCPKCGSAQARSGGYQECCKIRL
ncbi:hypothetical protein SAMN04488156_104204 [Bacillus sp. 166amftsu]|nr:hypothetical protein SAMN04488156_104204 [Bacillus sp. 166amftsu]